MFGVGHRPYEGMYVNWFIAREGRFEQVNSREPIHVAPDRQPEKIQNCRGKVDERCARETALRDRAAKRKNETIRCRFVRAADLRVAGDELEHAFAGRHRLHPEAGHYQQQIVRPEALDLLADERVEKAVVLLQHAAEPLALLRRHVTERRRVRIAQESMPDGIDAGETRGDEARRADVEPVEQLQVHAIGDHRRAIGAHVVIVHRLRCAHGRDQRHRIRRGRRLQRDAHVGQQLRRPDRRRGIEIQLGFREAMKRLADDEARDGGGGCERPSDDADARAAIVQNVPNRARQQVPGGVRFLGQESERDQRLREAIIREQLNHRATRARYVAAARMPLSIGSGHASRSTPAPRAWASAWPGSTPRPDRQSCRRSADVRPRRPA